MTSKTVGAVADARLRQARSNLLNNAVQHGDPASPVSVVAGRNGQEIVIAVTNHGEPIPPESLQVIFDPPVQLSPDPRERRSGLPPTSASDCSSPVRSPWATRARST